MAKITRIGLGLALTAAVVVGSAGAIGAANCPAGKVCFFSGGSLTGVQLNVSGKVGISNRVGQSPLEDQVTSVLNGTSHAVRLFDELNARALIACLAPLASADFGSPTGVSSMKVLRRSVC